MVQLIIFNSFQLVHNDSLKNQFNSLSKLIYQLIIDLTNLINRSSPILNHA